MSGPKIVILVLVLIAVLFAVGVGVGLGRDNRPPADNKQAAGGYKPSGFMKWIGGVLSRGRPKLKLDDPTINVPAGGRTIDIPAAKSPFRTATFVLIAGQGVTITYFARAEGGSEVPDDLKEQDLDLPRDDVSDPAERMRGSLAIVKGGGTMTFRRVGQSACQVRLE